MTADTLATETTPYVLHRGDALGAYRRWPTPATVISDGAYGIRGFHGDTTGSEGLLEWYRPHVAAWSESARPATTLWFWNTELGWATVHPLLAEHGWDYVQTVTWDKGISHIAGNVNGKTIRRFPVVSEVCALYQRRLEVPGPDGSMPVQQWLRHEWQRSGLPLYRANEACGVRDAATRKYLTRDWLWYWPPGPMMERLATYASSYGLDSGWPYFSLDGETPITAKTWDGLRYTWNHTHGVTNVWSRPPLHDTERLKGTLRRAAPRVYRPTRASAAHLNQKPLEIMERLVHAVTEEGDVVWEPFAGLATAAVAAVALGRHPYAAELDEHYARLAAERLRLAVDERDADAEQQRSTPRDPTRPGTAPPTHTTPGHPTEKGNPMATTEQQIPETLRPWTVAWRDYTPVDITPPELRTPERAATQHWVLDTATDPAHIRDQLASRRPHALVPYELDDSGRPLHPCGRTGRTGRDLGRWAENPAADPIVLTGTGHHRHVLLIRRGDCGAWAIPGGHIDPGETVTHALARELHEETGVDVTSLTPHIIARGVVADPRATDHAWIVTVAATYSLPSPVMPAAGDDAADARWWPATNLHTLERAIQAAGGELYTAHQPLLATALT